MTKANETTQTNKPEAPKTQSEFEKDIMDFAAASRQNNPKVEGAANNAVQDALNEIAGGAREDLGYEDLKFILELAYEQSATGKGRERHAIGPVGFRPWSQQPILEISRMVGPGYAAGQVAKKVQEAVTMVGNGKHEAAQQEALGAIVYAAALYKLIFEMKTDR